MPFWSNPKRNPDAEWTQHPLSFMKGSNDVQRPRLKTSESSRAQRSQSTAVVTLDGPKLPLPVTESSRNGRQSKKKVQFAGSWSRLWYEFKQSMGPGSEPASLCDAGPSSVSSFRNTESRKSVEEGVVDLAAVEKVIVDRPWTGSADAGEETSATTEDEKTPEMSGTSPAKRRVWEDSDLVNATSSRRVWFVIRWQVWTALLDFFFPKGFSSKEAEEHYQQEDWFVSKPLAIFSAVWFIFNWVLGISFFPKPFQTIDYVFYCAVCPAFSLPVVFMVIFNWPRRHPVIYQVLLTIAVWIWSFYFVLFIYLCGLYDHSHSFFSCNNRDFIGLFYYLVALQTIALFALKMQRFPAAVGATTFFIFSCVAIIPDKPNWGRTMINFFVYHVFLIFVHYVRENAQRRLHHLRSQVRLQYKAMQRAQQNERKMADSKYRLTSYVFHDMFFSVRVPLNAAAIALQNMAASGTIMDEMELEFSALSGSLQTMSQVLNDVLDFNRIDGGYFESVSKQFNFHKAMRTLTKTVEVMTIAKHLEFTVNLDPEIDKAARHAAYKTMGQPEEAIAQYIQTTPDIEGVVVGDEARLSQIIHNFASNACKFTEPGGKVSISTRLVRTTGTDLLQQDVIDVQPIKVPNQRRDRLSATNLSLHNQDQPCSHPSIIVRIEVNDTGCGISKKESERLFSPFHQTEQGRTQGGYGSGLGLSLVRSIVKLLGGRLGFSSEKDVGSLFWVELPLGVGYEPKSESSNGGAGVDYLTAGRTMLPSPDIANTERLVMPVDAAALQASAASNSLSNVADRAKAIDSLHSRKSSYETSAYGLTRSSSPPSPLSTRTPVRHMPPQVETPSVKPQAKSPRPTNVAMPTSPPFALDPQPTSSTGVSSFSSTNSNPMAVFDRAFNNASSSTRDLDELPPPKDLSVLVVDDDYVTRSMMGRLLERLGCKVAVAENGKVAVQMVLGHGFTPAIDEAASTYFQPLRPIMHESEDPANGLSPSQAVASGRKSEPGSVPGSPRSSSLIPSYDLVFLDNQMPQMSGLQAIRLLRTLGRRDFVVGLTGNALLPDQREYIDAGVDQVLTKPVNKKDLEDILKQADSRRRRTSRSLQPDQPP